MAIKVIGTLIGALILGVGVYYLFKERGDKEARKIYGIISSVGGVVFIAMLAVTILTLM